MSAFFLPGEARQCFCLYHAASNGKARGAVIYVHPFAEEMNKARRMAGLQARALAATGFDVMQVDLTGCGDSSGDFSEASWQIWQDDILAARKWLRTQSSAPLSIWGLRAGCLLAAGVALQLPEAADFIFWQPVSSGKLHWQQFMRLKMAGELASGQAKGITEQLKQQLVAGQAVEIAGYTVAPSLAEGLAGAELAPPPGRHGRMIWLEVSTREDATLAPASQKQIEQWQAAGFVVDAEVVPGPAFWQTSEIEDAPALVTATLALMEKWQ